MCVYMMHFGLKGNRQLNPFLLARSSLRPVNVRDFNSVYDRRRLREERRKSEVPLSFVR